MENSHIGREHTHAQETMTATAKQVVSRHLAGAGPLKFAAAQPVPAQPTPIPDLGSHATSRRYEATEHPDPDEDDPDEDFGFLDGRWTSNSW